MAACLERGLRDVERAARIVHLRRLEEMPDSLVTGSATSVFKAGQELGLIPGEASERLIGAALMWRNLAGIRQLILEDDVPEDELPDSVRSIMAQACGQEHWEALVDAVHDAATATESGLNTVLSSSR